LSGAKLLLAICCSRIVVVTSRQGVHRARAIISFRRLIEGREPKGNRQRSFPSLMGEGKLKLNLGFRITPLRSLPLAFPLTRPRSPLTLLPSRLMLLRSSLNLLRSPLTLLRSLLLRLLLRTLLTLLRTPLTLLHSPPTLKLRLRFLLTTPPLTVRS
jgi:hypothetical protein